MDYVYMYGMIVNSKIYFLKGDFPKPDEYKEIEAIYSFPGGETGSGAVVIAKLGLKVKLAGSFLGSNIYKSMIEYFQERNIDCCELDSTRTFQGFNDIIFISNDSRTIFGEFGKLLFDNKRYWSMPKEDSIKNSKICSIDPFFGEESKIAAEYAIKFEKKYTTIDNHYESFISKNAEIIVCSKEFIDREYKGIDKYKLFQEYVNHCRGLVIFTFGKNEILYGRSGQKVKKFTPFKVNAIDTLGAGDAFKGAVTYGLYMDWDDDKIVQFASAVSAILCERTPGVLYPPNLDEVQNFIKLRY